MTQAFNEAVVEKIALGWFEALGYAVAYGPDIAHDGERPERTSYADVVLVGRLRTALTAINPDLPEPAIEDAITHLRKVESPSLLANNERFHDLLFRGVPVQYRRADGTLKGDRVRLFDFDKPERNDWLVVNQFTVQEPRGQARRPDIVVFVNGLPVAVIELKNPADENATVWAAFNQLQTYKAEIPSLFITNELLVITDGLDARLGSLTADKDRFMPWRTIDGVDVATLTQPQLEVLLRGVFDRRWFLDYLRHFIVFESDGKTTLKKVAGYHQFHAVRKAASATVQATQPQGDRRCGVVWHTQGSGKSLSMLFYAGKLIEEPAMQNPTILVLTDRNDLDDQLFGTFSRCKALLHQNPVQAESRADLKDKLRVASGGVVFTTIQKFLREPGAAKDALSDRRNIVVIADEAHRSQYDFQDGLAMQMREALPNASFIGFTGTPIALADKNTRAVFGNYIDIYDMQRSIEDKATVPIYYEARHAKIGLDPEKAPRIDPEFDEVTEGEEQEQKERAKSKWAAIEALVGAPDRLKLVAADIVEHFLKRLDALEGKAMIVCMSRRICMDLYDLIRELRPEWHHEDDGKGALKVVMTGSAAEGPRVAFHARTKGRREALAARYKDPKDPLKLVIVRDMWLTGFDCPSMHTLYMDKPMRGHNLMQAIARVNRVFRDKPGGLIVDYLGLADHLQRAMKEYINDGGKGDLKLDQEKAVELMLEALEKIDAMFYGFDASKFYSGTPEERLAVIPPAMEHILKQEDGKTRYLDAVTHLSKAFALSVPNPRALQERDKVGFYQFVRAQLVKSSGVQRSQEDLDIAIRQIVSQAVAGQGVVDIFAAAGLKTPNIGILDEAFLNEVRALPQKHLALELLRKLINDEIKVRSKRNSVEARSFREMLEKAIRSYGNKAITTAEVIEELVKLAKDMKKSSGRGETLGLQDDEVAFYDALATNDSAVQVLGDVTLKTIAREVAERIKNSVSIDWTIKETVRAGLRAQVKRVLRKHGYPPDKQEAATDIVMEQAELLCGNLTE